MRLCFVAFDCNNFSRRRERPQCSMLTQTASENGIRTPLVYLRSDAPSFLAIALANDAFVPSNAAFIKGAIGPYFGNILTPARRWIYGLPGLLWTLQGSEYSSSC